MRAFPIDFDNIRATLCEAIMYGMGLDTNQVIAMEPEVAGFARPALPYLGFKLTSPAIRKGDDASQVVRVSDSGDDMLMRRFGMRRMTVSFQTFGKTHEQAWSMMALWQAMLADHEVREVLSRGTVAVWQIGAVIDLSVAMNTGFEGRAQMSVDFGVLSSIELWVPVIRTVIADGTVNPQSPAQQEVNVTVSTGA